VALPPAPAGARLTPRVRVATAAVLALVVAACVALLIWMSLGGRASADGGLNLPDEREQVMSLTDQFVKRLGTYSPDMLDDSGQMPEYRDQVHEVITPKFAADFDKQVATAEQLVAQGGITRTADVFATAVSSIDDDSARVLVAGAFTDSYAQGTGKKATTVDQEPLPFRFTVDLVMIEGEWLVDDFSPVSSPDDETGTEGSTP
jgi:Mce-associated membrane protein